MSTSLRTLRLSSTGGSRTLASILSSGSSSAGAGSTMRVFNFYKKLYNNNINEFYKNIFNLTYGEYRSQYKFR
jgi:hypothetical protein